MNIIEAKNLSKSYGPLKAVDDFSFEAAKGEILALVGPDGAGKTSIFRSVCGLLHYDTGSIKIAGFDVAAEFDKIKPLLGYMPQSFSLYPDLSVEENLSFYAGMFGLGKKEYSEKRKRLYEFSGLGPFSGRRAGALSGGMKQKLALSCALIHDPEVLMLDEPTTGVDPLSRRQFWEILKSLKSGGSAIVVSTPYMDEVALSDRAIFVYQGKKLAEGTPKQLTQKYHGHVYRADINPTPETMANLNRIEGLTSRRFGSSVHIYTRGDNDIAGYAGELKRVGLPAEKVFPIDAGLEDTFIQLMGS